MYHVLIIFFCLLIRHFGLFTQPVLICDNGSRALNSTHNWLGRAEPWHFYLLLILLDLFFFNCYEVVLLLVTLITSFQ